MNEATFESYLAQILSSIFPTPIAARFQAQPVFSLQLGHKAFEVDGFQSLARGRADLILRLNEAPVILLELKAPNIDLSEDDVRQGLSYARLHEPMIPLTAVTNGTETSVYSTFNGERIHGASMNEQILQKLLEQAGNQAVTSRDDAVRALIGGNPAVWASALRVESDRVLSDLEAPLGDLTKPLSTDFQLPRQATAYLAGLFKIEKEKALALVGPPLSGKTNVIAELCRRSQDFGLATLYVDCTEASDLLEEVSRALTDSLGATIPRDQVFDWLRLGVGTIGDERPRFILILDSLFPSDSAELMKQATQLLSIAGDNFSVLFALTDGDWDRVQSMPGRTTLSKLGRHAKPLMLGELNDDELDVAKQNLQSAFRVLLPEPYQFELTMRQPHSLRLLMSTITRDKDLPEGMVEQVPPIIKTDFLATLWERTAGNAELRADYLALAECCIDDIGNREKQAHLAAISMGVGAISSDGAAKLPTPIFERLLAQGHIKRVSLASSVVIVPTVPELLSAACVHVMLPKVLAIAHEQDNTAAKVLLLRSTRSLALGDRVAAAILTELVRKDAAILMGIFEMLMEDEPKEEIKEHGNFLLPLPGGKVIELLFDGETMLMKLPDGSEKKMDWPEDEGPMRLISDLHAWHILSHLSYAGIALQQDGAVFPLAPSIFMRVGKFRSTLRDIGRASLHHANSVYEHSLPGYGTVPCPGRGIVEPIAYGMAASIQSLGDVMDEVVDEAIKEADPALLMRLYVAANSLDGIADSDIAARADRMTKKLHTALDEVFEVMHEESE
jgi:Type I restriction enzyme R protein N terminus (HSDR_N)